jgi:hypothetical protein
MPFHFHGAPPHLLPILLSSALAFAAGAYVMSRGRLPAVLKSYRERAGERFSAWQRAPERGREGTTSRHDTSTRTPVNTAFEDYRTQTMTKLEQEAAEFRDYLENLRKAKDRAEFNEYMAGRRQNPPGETP